MKKFRVQYDVTLRFSAFVEVEGEYKDDYDSKIEADANKIVRRMDPRDMAFDDEDYEVLDIVEIE